MLSSRFSRRLSTLFALLALSLAFGLLATGDAQAATRDGLTFKIDCEGFISRGGAINLTRDNTGVGRELISFIATDGLGNVIYNPTSESFVVGGRLTFPIGLYFPYNSAPQANPIVVRIISNAGNDQMEQTIYSSSDSCADLPSVLVSDALDNFGFIIYDILDGRTSPTVPLNQPAPRPINPEGLAGAGRPGYVIVNTGSLNVRSGDGPEYTVVGIVTAGTELIVLGRNEDRSWWYVQVGEIIGWVNADLVFIRGDLTSAPLVPVLGEIAQPRFVLFNAAGLARIPIDGSLAICELPANLDFFIVGRNAQATWYEVEATCGGATVTGWLKAEWGAVRNPSASFIPVTD
jgi:hypothetical protein